MVLKKLKQVNNPTVVQAGPLTEFVASLFAVAGMSAAHATESAKVLVDADLNGIDTHGVCYNLDLHYLAGLLDGYINARPECTVVHETPSTALVDGDQGVGMISGRFGMNLAIEKAKAVGSACVAVKNSSHYGAAGYYARMAVPHDMIGLTFSSGGPRVIIPMGARDPWMGTNPIAFAAPANEEPPFVIDMATSVVSYGKVAIARAFGLQIPEGWAVLEDGTPVTDPANSPMPHGQPPLGTSHEQGAQKGYGLAMIADVLGGVLPGETLSGMMLDNPRGGRFCQYYQAIRVDAFRPADDFKSDMDSALRALTAQPIAKGHDRVQYPGLPEHEAYRERIESGIPLPMHTVEYFKRMADELNVPYTIGG